MYGACVISASLSHEISLYPGNTATPSIRPNFYDALVAILTGFHCTCFIFIFIFCYCLRCMLIPLVHLFDVVVFTDMPVDVKGSFIMSMYVLGLCYMRFRTATCNVIDGFLVVVANSAHRVEIDVLIQNSVLVGSRCQALPPPPPPPLLLLLHYYGGCCCIFPNILKVMWWCDVLLPYFGGCCCIFLNILKVMFMLCVWHFQNHWVKNFMLRWRTSGKTMFKVCMR